VVGHRLVNRLDAQVVAAPGSRPADLLLGGHAPEQLTVERLDAQQVGRRSQARTGPSRSSAGRRPAIRQTSTQPPLRQ
jgi:hypothetical protein